MTEQRQTLPARRRPVGMSPEHALHRLMMEDAKQIARVARTKFPPLVAPIKNQRRILPASASPIGGNPSAVLAHLVAVGDWQSREQIDKALGMNGKTSRDATQRLMNRGYIEKRTVPRKVMGGTMGQWRALPGVTVPAPQEKPLTNLQKIGRALSNEYKPTALVAKAAGISQKAALKVLNRMHDKGEVDRKNNQWRRKRAAADIARDKIAEDALSYAREMENISVNDVMEKFGLSKQQTHTVVKRLEREGKIELIGRAGGQGNAFLWRAVK